jgi:dTDP-4-amino-4,6-dideoxygalactose transaminase
MTPIWFNRPAVTGHELKYMRAAIDAGRISGDAAFTKRCQLLLERRTGAGKALLTTSCTHALEMAALLLDIRPGDEVICPAFTFVSTINAFALRGAHPVFVDIRPDTLNLDESMIEAAITPRTRAIVVMHYAGVACAMDCILAIAQRHGLVVVEDNAHGLFGGYRGRPLGSLGALATLSFHETKNITCGEGGALLINDERLVARAEVIREKGTDRSRFFRGEIDKYSWIDLGSSYLPSDMLAAYLLAQLESVDDIQARRHQLWSRYQSALQSDAARQGVGLPTVPDDAEHPAHIFYLLLPSLEHRTALIAHMRERMVALVFHYQPLNLSEMAQKLTARVVRMPVAEAVADRLVRLPLYLGLTDAEQDRVVSGICEFLRAKF